LRRGDGFIGRAAYQGFSPLRRATTRVRGHSGSSGGVTRKKSTRPSTVR
jgi:hypothetical protein